MTTTNSSNKRLLLAILPLALVILVSFFLQLTVISRRAEVVTWLAQFGPGVILIYALFQTVTIVIAPIGGAFIWIAMLAVMGPVKGLILSYLVTTPAYFVNFFLARRYGRGIVRRLIGNKALEKVDHIASDAGIGTLLILKIFQGGYFDYISYAAGLVRAITPKAFIVVNVFGGIPATVISYFVFTTIPTFTLQIVALYVLTAAMIAISIALTHWRKRHRIDRV